jgi:hypothetical protein
MVGRVTISTMPSRYQTGLEIRKGDRVLFHGELGEIEFVVDPEKPEPETDSYLREYGAGVMVREPKNFGSAFIPEPDAEGDLKFVSRDLDTMLVRSVREYIALAGGDEAEVQQMRSVYSVLVQLLSGLLQGNEKWSRYYWVDDILQSSIAVLSENEVSVLGWVIWGQTKQTREWVEPFRAFVHVPHDSDTVLRYELFFGDAAEGLGNGPYRRGLAYKDPTLPEEWIFKFSAERAITHKQTTVSKKNL